MTTPFDKAINTIAAAGYHNHRREGHSDTVSTALFEDLLKRCAPLREDWERGVVKVWKNVRAPGGRRRKVDLFVGEPTLDGKPDVHTVRIAVENKSVITAHRNATNRFDDLREVLAAIYSVRPQALLIATILVGLSRRVLNIPDQVHAFFRDREEEFKNGVLPRLSTGDATLWEQFDWAVSHNAPNDAQRTVDLLRTLPTRPPGQTHLEGYDYVLIAPVRIDNVNAPALARPNPLGIDVDADYRTMLEKLCSGYTARWHM